MAVAACWAPSLRRATLAIIIIWWSLVWYATHCGIFVFQRRNHSDADNAIISSRDQSVVNPGRSMCTDESESKISCLQQALWGKCSAAFLQTTCNRSCGRCKSRRQQLLHQRVLLLSARQPGRCSTAEAEEWLRRAHALRQRYARAHGMRVAYSRETVDPDNFTGAWNKLALLHQQMRSELQSAELDSRSPTFAWILWADWDALITDVESGWWSAATQMACTGAPTTRSSTRG